MTGGPEQESSVDQAMADLTDALGAPPPDGLVHADPATLVALARAIRTAREQQEEALGAATDRALGHIPRLLRGPVLRLLGGGR
jgi:hypothetical protein